ncbi:MAG: DUF1614 domain-containing protein [Planctomycetes bacterium]|nr:DUF1614 domain-containing protein [Planctomycetota bacterium]
MQPSQPPMPPVLPALGCLTLASVMLFLFLMPFLFVDMMHQALSRLHLSPGAALLAVLAILIGSLINLPVHRIEREELQVMHPFAVWGPWWLSPTFQRVRQETVIAVNVGGCVVPSLIAAWQLPFLAASGPALLAATALVSAANITACYFAARPVPGIGIMMPGLISPAVSLLFTWMVLPMDAPERASVAFVAGILGPLVGADLLHLKEIGKVSTGLLSIGGAGTFDGIVLSGVLAALLA